MPTDFARDIKRDLTYFEDRSRAVRERLDWIDRKVSARFEQLDDVLLQIENKQTCPTGHHIMLYSNTQLCRGRIICLECEGENEWTLIHSLTGN
jgi:hypothetical protein